MGLTIIKSSDMVGEGPDWYTRTVNLNSAQPYQLDSSWAGGNEITLYTITR